MLPGDMKDPLDKTNRINLLFDFYRPLLTEKQQLFLEMYFHDDYSLGEIAGQMGISRQAVYEAIKRAEAVMTEYETRLELLRQHETRSRLLDALERSLGSDDAVLLKRVKPLIDQLRRMDLADPEGMG